MKFKEGDRVRVLEIDRGIVFCKAGDVGRILFTAQTGRLLIGFGKTNGWFLESQLELCSDEPTPAAVREFTTGATRDLDDSKLDYEGFLSPLVLKRFSEHMHAARQLPDGSMRNSDNWQLGIPKDVYMKSMWRHFMDVWKHHRGSETGTDIEAELSALMFNVMGYLHEHLKAKSALSG